MRTTRHPSGADTYPDGAGTYPGGADTHPRGADMYPDGDAGINAGAVSAGMYYGGAGI